MARITLTFTKPVGSPEWVSTGRSDINKHFTLDEILNVFLPYKKILDNLPGIISRAPVSKTDTTFILEYVFDTIENANYAAKILFGDYADSPIEVVKFRNLMSEKTEAIGQTFAYTVK